MKQKKENPGKIGTGKKAERRFIVLKQVGEDCSNEQIAEKMKENLHTVVKDLKSIFKTLKAHSRAGAVHTAWKTGIFTKENC
ncbi:MAG: hypothetical protein HY841_04175 [Bacteroidetes bacterium]|nr:hypothetical protein [Bacteroidota bacterium]